MIVDEFAKELYNMMGRHVDISDETGHEIIWCKSLAKELLDKFAIRRRGTVPHYKAESEAEDKNRRI
ncbi:MAG: hypothetical protein ACE5GN_03045 [Waddliaceae bacterium]